MTTTERPERSVPKPEFTDAEAGAREFPDSSAAARRYNYFKADSTTQRQQDPSHADQ
jgi:propane monooxygenase small subunit